MLDRSSSPKEVEDKRDYRHNQQQMNESTGDMERNP
jgi:hypothetical protein